jgi:hypothetical protein
MITKMTMVVMKITGDYEDDCGDCENDCGIRCDPVQCRRSCRLHLLFRRYRQCHSPRLHNPEVHLYPTAGRNTSRIASSPAAENMCKSPVFAATSVLFIGNEYDMHVEHETVCCDNISIYILRSRARPFVKHDVK